MTGQHWLAQWQEQPWPAVHMHVVVSCMLDAQPHTTIGRLTLRECGIMILFHLQVR